jgi:hypothetical protein
MKARLTDLISIFQHLRAAHLLIFNLWFAQFLFELARIQLLALIQGPSAENVAKF